jgi:hypothetical protein
MKKAREKLLRLLIRNFGTERLESGLTKPGEKRDAALVLHGFLHGVQAREEIKEQEAQSA